MAVLCNWPYTNSMSVLGMAKLIPSLPPDCVRMNVSRPTISPAVFTSGPPLFPRLIGASVVNVDEWSIRIGLARNRAHDSHAHRVVQAFRASEGKDDLAFGGDSCIPQTAKRADPSPQP